MPSAEAEPAARCKPTDWQWETEGEPEASDGEELDGQPSTLEAGLGAGCQDHTEGCVEADTLQVEPEVLHILESGQGIMALVKQAAALSQVVMGFTDGGIHNHRFFLQVHKHLHVVENAQTKALPVRMNSNMQISRFRQQKRG